MMLRVKNLSFQYGKREILKGINLELEKGQLLSVVGPNGVGKTTLLKCVLHILQPTEGDVTVEGKDTARISSRERAKHLAYVPQAYPFKFPMSVFDTVLLGRIPHINWNPDPNDIRKVLAVLETMGLESVSLHDFDQLSGGQKQKVILARALVQETDYLLLDEPTNNLDLKHQLEVMELLRLKARENRIGIMVAIHDLNLACQFSDMVVMMKGGEVLCSGEPCKVMTCENIRFIYGVEVRSVTTNGNRYFVPAKAL
ncbi:MAG: ABC transporter ATP-binding protein [Deltaproteobacteria bacterium]|nr:MAG: ABC transporter ATP-binding protein [Deltaproteobacteria bacterium]